MAEHSPVPFTIAIADQELDDLAIRLRRTRWPDEEPVDDWSQGVPLSYLQRLCAYWADGYDWRATEQRLNQLDHFRLRLDDLDLHLVHARSPHTGALPLILTHGWPGSFLEFEEVIGPLTDPTSHGGEAGDAFHVVCPSLPGYGFSGKPTTVGWGVARVAETWARLMAVLGYDRYGAQGGDWGSMVTTALGSIDPDHCIGIHTNMAIGRRPRTADGQAAAATSGGDEATTVRPGEETELFSERQALAALAHYRSQESGYSTVQSTRPQTVGYGLTDSPAGQAAWMVEKFRSWSDGDGDPDDVLGRDRMLDTIMLYWLNRAATSSARLYWESFGRYRPDPVPVPAGIANFRAEILPVPRSWAEQTYLDIRHWTTIAPGGHFAAWEQPRAFVDDVRAFFRLVR